MQKLKQHLFFDRVLEKLPDHVTLLLVVLSGFLLARLTWMLFPADPQLMASVAEEQPAAVEVIPANATAADPGKEIAGYHLLGVYQPPREPVKTVAAASAPAPVPQKPRDPIKLVGVYALGGKAGVAVLDVKGQQQVVGIGETIAGNGAVLERVFDDRVELSWNGQIETINMPKLEQSESGAMIIEPEFIPEPEPEPVFDQQLQPQIDPASGAAVAPDGQDGVDPEEGDEQLLQPDQTSRMTPAAGQSVASDAALPSRQPGAGAEPGTTLASFRQQVMENNLKLLEVVRPMPVKKNGQLTGFRVAPGRNRALFRQTGLRPGDIVTEINGSPLSSDAASLQAMQSLASSSGAQLTVLRGGQVTSIQVAF